MEAAEGKCAEQVEAAFRLARSGNREAFAQWMGMVEVPLRRSLSRFARAVDVEAVIQETFLRMWMVAGDPRRVLEGGSASLKFAHAVARNVAFEEMRRCRQDHLVDLEVLDNMPEGRWEPDPPDPALARAISKCIQILPRQPRQALKARFRDGGRPDRDLAAELHMKVNTFLQNIVRARRMLRECLEKRGVRLTEILS